MITILKKNYNNSKRFSFSVNVQCLRTKKRILINNNNKQTQLCKVCLCTKGFTVRINRTIHALEELLQYVCQFVSKHVRISAMDSPSLSFIKKLIVRVMI